MSGTAKPAQADTILLTDKSAIYCPDIMYYNKYHPAILHFIYIPFHAVVINTLQSQTEDGQ